jgi:hypothetical protein
MFELDINATVNLCNKKTTTVDDICKLLFDTIRTYQDTREIHYLQEFKESRDHNFSAELLDSADEIAEDIARKVERDVNKFVVKYADECIDKVLDAKNEKRFKLKRSADSLLILLSTLKETYQ